jgi:4-hydroxy-4-methyl-2-oxoglutarate aldolase
MEKKIPISALARLRDLDSPTVSNGIDSLNIREHTQGFISSEVRCQFPELNPMVGYAVTCTADSTTPGTGRPNRLDELIDAIRSAPQPAVVVIQNCGPDKPRSCFVGDMATMFFQKLGAVGAVTDGGVRDLRGIRERSPGFQLFSTGKVVSHGTAGMVEVGIPVKIAGLDIFPGDLLHGDESGLLTVPSEEIEAILEQAELVRKKEQEWVDFMRSPSFNIAEMKRRFTH